MDSFLIQAIEQTVRSLSPMTTVLMSLQKLADSMFEERRDVLRVRQSVIAASSELRERELIKLARLSDAIAALLRQRGVDEFEASLIGETASAVFKIAFERWVTDTNSVTFYSLISETAHQIRTVTTDALPSR